ncbi:MAG: hypothetical protein VXX85_07635, partial [Candidatus Margulisiibacteriota bacterium]|nr:hypothetical protein [Candidatus Margulisiibacteriota bacterium]
SSNNKQIAYSDSFCSFETDFLPKGVDGHNCEKSDKVNIVNFISDLYESYLKTIYKSQNNTLILANEALWQVAISTVLVQPFFYARVNYQLGQTLSFKPSVIFRGILYNLIPRVPSTFVVWGTQSSFDSISPLSKAVMTALFASPFIHLAELLANCRSNSQESLGDVIRCRPFAGLSSIVFRELIFCMLFWAARDPLNQSISSTELFNDLSPFLQSQLSLFMITNLIGVGTISADHFSTLAKKGQSLTLDFIKSELPNSFKGLPFRVVQVHVFLSIFNSIINQQKEYREKYLKPS